MFQIIVGYFEHDVSLIFQLNSPQEINDNRIDIQRTVVSPYFKPKLRNLNETESEFYRISDTDPTFRPFLSLVISPWPSHFIR